MPRLPAIAALLAAIGTVTAMQMPTKQIISTGPAPAGPYSPAVTAGGLIYVSGTLARDEAGAIVGKGDVATQTRRVIECMRGVLSAAGSSLDGVVSVTVYLKSAADFQSMNDAYQAFWTKDPPTRTTVIANFVLADALVEISMIAVPAGSERVVIHPDTWMRSPSPYSYAIRSGDTLFISGLVSRKGRDNSVVSGDIATQTRTVLENAGELLKAAGLSFAHVVSARVFLPDAADFQKMNEAYRSFFSSAPPARATVVAGLAGRDYVVEISLVASSSQKEAIHVGGEINPNLSAAIRVGHRLYLSGVLGNTPETKGNPAAQTQETLGRIGRVLTAAGFTPSEVVDAVVYLTDAANFNAMNGAYRAFFQGDFPARATVRTGLVAPDGLVEIMVMAVKP